jgi:predicted XRE-type DNA-binding protein
MMNSTVFTIEQVDLIRRLRRTGIPLDKLVYAYREMDRLERESVQQTAQLSLKNSHNSTFNTFNASLSNINNNNNHSTNNGNGTSVNSHLNSNNNSNNSNNATSNNAIGNSNANNSTLNLTGPIDQLNMSNESLNSYDQNMSAQFGISLPSTSKLASTPNFVDEHAELMEFKKKGESAMLMEIRSFVAKYNIRQNMLAEMTGISQGYISRFFRGEGQDISERARNLIYSWYLNFRRNPTKILQCCPMTVGDRKMISESGDLLPIRRDRFIFRKQHLQVLEQYFAENPYPDSHTKEQIAEECNSAAERVSSTSLNMAISRQNRISQ